MTKIHKRMRMNDHRVHSWLKHFRNTNRCSLMLNFEQGGIFLKDKKDKEKSLERIERLISYSEKKIGARKQSKIATGST